MAGPVIDRQPERGPALRRARPAGRPGAAAVPAGALLAGCLLVAAAARAGGGSVAWEIPAPNPGAIPGYAQTPVWGGATPTPGDAEPAAPDPWDRRSGWQQPPGPWSPAGRASDPQVWGQEAPGEPGAAVPWVDAGPYDRAEPGPVPGLAAPGYDSGGGESDYRFRADGADADFDSRRHWSSDDARAPSAGAYPGYRFRGDPAPQGGLWAERPDGESFRFRPLSENERGRRGRSQGAAPPQPLPPTRWSEGPGRDPAAGHFDRFDPHPWQDP